MKRTLTSLPTRRHVLQGLLGAGLGLGSPRFPDVIAAKKKRKKKKKKQKQSVFNQFGCLDVGQPCKGDSTLCCSGICEGAAPTRKGKPDASRCVAHDTGTCNQAMEGLCTTPDLALVTCNNRSDCGCFRTTAGSNFCGGAFVGQCVTCQRDADCAALGLPAGSACAAVAEGHCAGLCPNGRACVFPCGVAPLPDQP